VNFLKFSLSFCSSENNKFLFFVKFQKEKRRKRKIEKQREQTENWHPPGRNPTVSLEESGPGRMSRLF